MDGTVRHNLRSLEEDLGLYADEALTAGARAMNRAATSVRAEGVRQISAQLAGLKQGTIRRQTTIERATRKNMRAVVEFNAKRFRLFSNFATRQTKKGVPLRRLPWRIETLDGDVVSPSDLRRAFIQRSRRTSQPNIWIRIGEGRFPITALLAPSAATTFDQRGLAEGILRLGRDRFSVSFDSEAKFLTRKRGSFGAWYGS